ncbi:hypothetical protein PRZ48_010329 [Zasmidium cellare]|uniref:DUF7779 domain-containing protein n=1 Tax=Zasmidium cellare TaxID=395010 RepID=A0ABR0E8X0_ZASCE|nr:hypothetical protein PRZ48_010329 [Zasmidium cellare]
MAAPRKATFMANSSTRSSNGGLKWIKQCDTAVVDFIIIAIPWLMKAADFAICTASCDLPLGSANIFGYEILATVDDSFTWQDLLECGNHLVKILDGHRSSQGPESRPIILMAHSLAGFAVKQCLNIADAQSDRYRSLKDAFCGVVLMGCPHAVTDDRRETLYDRSSTILRLNHASARRINGRLETGNELLQVCKQFDEICSSLNVVLLHELRPTKIPTRFRHSAQYLVDKQLATMNGVPIKGTTIGIENDHVHIPLLRSETPPNPVDHEAIQAIKNLLRPLPKAATSSKDPIPLQSLVEDFIGLKIPDLPTCRFMVDMSRKRNAYFSGREDVLANLAQRLLGGPSIAFLQGFGGLGKSECALEFAHRHKSKFDAVFWVQADEVSKMRQDFGHFAALLGLEDASHSKDPFASRELVKSWLKNPVMSSPSGGSVRAKWLIVFDGADSPDVLDEFESIQGQGSILITGRNPRTVDVFSKASSKSDGSTSKQPLAIKIGPFGIEEAATMFKRLAQVPHDEEELVARRIVTLLDGWPLAISQMAGIVRTQFLTLAQFYERYNNVAIRCNLQAQEATAIPETGRETMVSSMRMKKLSPQATALLQVFAMLDPDCIQETLFTTLPSTVPLDGFPTTPDEFEKARNELLGSSIVEINRGKKELWLHRVLQDTVRGQCSKIEYDCSFRTAALLVKRAFKSPGTGVRDSLKLWEPCAAFLGHVLHLQQCYETQAMVDVGLTKTVRPCFEFAWLLSENATFERNLGNTPGLKRTLHLALAICDDPPGLPKKDTFELRGELYHSLGAWANETNHPIECVEFNGRYLEMAVSALTEGAAPNQRTAMAYNQYGTGQMMIRQHGSAMNAFQKSMDLYRSLSTDSPCGDSLPRVNLATAKWLIGDLEGADALLQAGLLAREEAFGFMDQENFRTGRFYHTLGNVRWSQGRAEESEIWHRRALKQYLSVLGPVHHRTADVRHKVAEHCLRNGDFDNAGTLIEQALTSWKLDASSFKQEIARTTWLKSRQRGMSGNPDEARELREEAYRMRQQLRPDDARPWHELTEEDFDDLVAFWSR